MKTGGRFSAFMALPALKLNLIVPEARTNHMQNYYVVSLRHTTRSSTYISFFRPANAGYSWPLSWAGRYSESEIEAQLKYYHNGQDTFAVMCDVVEDMAVPPAPGTVDNDAGPVVLNTRANWKRLLRESRWEPAKQPKPRYTVAPGVSARAEAASERADRLLEANHLIKIISDFGRRFFYNQTHDRVAKFAIGEKGHLFFVDDYTGKSIYIAYKHRWSGFSHGGTMRDLVRALGDYIRTGDRLSIGWIGPERRQITDGNIWGYPEDQMALCRAAALTTKAIRPLSPALGEAR